MGEKGAEIGRSDRRAMRRGEGPGERGGGGADKAWRGRKGMMNDGSGRKEEESRGGEWRVASGRAGRRNKA